MLTVEMRDDSQPQHTLTALWCQIAAAISLLLCLLKPLVRVIYPGCNFIHRGGSYICNDLNHGFEDNYLKECTLNCPPNLVRLKL